jgi:enolase
MIDKWLSIFTYNGVTKYNIVNQVTHEHTNISEEYYKEICDKYEIVFLENETLHERELNLYSILNK